MTASRSLSAGLLLFRRVGDRLELLVVHPGGPIWARRDDGAWSIPKGEIARDEDPLAAARREFAEELGSPAPAAEPLALGEVRLKSGKRVVAWALEGDLDADAITSNTFEMQWPPRSGRTQAFPEVDRAAWLEPELARVKLNPAQAEFVNRLVDMLDGSTKTGARSR
ncbi:MAG TPA: NUDIX domain-containing protein [Solirubrobacteraceae bacterium]|nr:NUDIX domain-containing protein [Solirubrobacteraceae bacterium]